MIRKYIAVIWPTGYVYRDEICDFYAAQRRVSDVSQFVSKHFPKSDDFMSFIYAVFSLTTIF